MCSLRVQAMKNPQSLISSATNIYNMLLFCWLLVATGVSGYSQITVGEISYLLPNETRSTPVWHTNLPAASPHPTLEVKNLGEIPVQACFYWKDSWQLQTTDMFCDVLCSSSSSCNSSSTSGNGCDGSSSNSSVNIWYALPGAVLIQPGQAAVIKTPDNAFYYTRLLVEAKAGEGDVDKKAAILVEDKATDKPMLLFTKDGPFSTPNSIEMLKKTFEWSLSKIPVHFKTTGLQALIELVWPENKPSVWTEALDKIRYLMDPTTFNAQSIVLDGRMRQLKRQLEQLALEVIENQLDVRLHYMEIARNLIGLEDEFIVDNHYNAGKHVGDMLPIYSNVIQLKAGFYGLGLKCRAKINLTEENVANVKRYFVDTINNEKSGAKVRFYRIFRDRAELAAENEFDRTLYVQNEVQKDGYIRLWSNILDHPGERLLDNRISYSRLAGNSNAASEKHARAQPEEPLTPHFELGRYNELRKLVIYHKPCFCGKCVGGLQLLFGNGATYQFGNASRDSCTFNLDGVHRIRKISVRVLSANDTDIKKSGISSMEVYLSTSPNVARTVGCASSLADEKVFDAGSDHYIASIYASGEPSFALPQQNMAVSYLPESSPVDDIMDEKNWQDWTC